jgi:hypothetical protein
MKLSDFKIGEAFYAGTLKWQCTDIGTRTIAAIYLDEVNTTKVGSGDRISRKLNEEQARAEGWFNGPPYAVAEQLFNEDDIKNCSELPDYEDDDLNGP